MRKRKPRGWVGAVFEEAVGHTVVGFVFAIMLACVLGLMSCVSGVGFVLRTIESHGVDASMLVGVSLQPHDIGTEAHTGRQRYVFVDIDSGACAAVSPTNGLCETRSPATAEAAAQTARAIMKYHPRIVVLDTLLWDYYDESAAKQDIRAMRDEAAASRTPIVSVLPAEPGIGRTLAPAPDLIPEGLTAEALAHNKLPGPAVEFSPAFAKIGRDGSLVARVYPRHNNVETGGACHLYASLPFQVAHYLRNDRFEPIGACEHADSEDDSRMLYTLPTLVPGIISDPKVQSYRSRQLRGLYNYVSASDAIDYSDPSGPKLKGGKSQQQFDRAVVVVGTSAAGAQDRYETPIGTMSGAEIIINAIRSYSADAGIEEARPVTKIVAEISNAAVASAAFFLFWFVTEAINRRLERLKILKQRFRSKAKPNITDIHVVILRILVLLAFVSAILSAYLLVFIKSYLQIVHSMSAPYAVDTFTPVIAVSLEAFADGSKYVMELTHHAINAFTKYFYRRFRVMVWRAKRSVRRTGSPQIVDPSERHEADV